MTRNCTDREGYSGLRGDLNGKEIQRRGGMCMAGSFCHIAETNTAL